MLLAITLVGLGFSIRKSKWSLKTPAYCQASRAAKGQGGPAHPHSSLLTAAQAMLGSSLLLPALGATGSSHLVTWWLIPLGCQNTVCSSVLQPQRSSHTALIYYFILQIYWLNRF